MIAVVLISQHTGSGGGLSNRSQRRGIMSFPLFLISAQSRGSVLVQFRRYYNLFYVMTSGMREQVKDFCILSNERVVKDAVEGGKGLEGGVE